MVRRPHKHARLLAAFSGSSLLALVGMAVEAQEFRTLPLARPDLPAAVAAQPSALTVLAQAKEAAQPAQPKQPTKEAPVPVPPSAPTPPESQPGVAPFGSEAGGATGGEFASLAAPNMIGHARLGGFRSVSFFVNRSAGAGFTNAVGSTNISNANVADNNSPIPADSVYFRYTHFDDAVSVVGAGMQTPIQIAPGVFQGFTTTRFFDTDMYTFGLEKTFFDNQASVEFRLPFSRSLDPSLDLAYGRLTSGDLVQSPVPGVPGQFFQTAATPGNSLGNYATQFGDLALIFKWLFFRSEYWRFSMGLGGDIPTAPDERVRVTDFLGPLVNLADTVRFREFHIKNQTWVLSPFLAGVWTPTDRLFAQGFLQYDAPLNSSEVTYSEWVMQTPTAPQLRADRGLGRLAPPFTVHEHIQEQQLFHIDIGTGYWLVKNREARFLTGFAPSVELHYVTTLQNADIVYLPGDLTARLDPAQRMFVTDPPPPAPTVGNLRNRVDILDLTMGTTFEFAERTRLATAVAIPLRGDSNRTYDWELHLQLNYYFGGASRTPPPPNF
jgi:hypothetical protein